MSQFDNYDNDFVVCRSGVKVDQGDGIGVITVDGSAQCYRDPMRIMTDARLAAFPRFTELQPDRTGEKYCTGCGDWHAKSEYSPDSRNADGLRHKCRRCVAADHRHQYAARIIAEQGRQVRAYRRRTA